ncbi:MAG: phage shock protein operon transcriptional activator [Proteobacteria bacterium]|nr:phage shock protein operon transcriptional activator [Pseudomonadota bacterium]
MTTRPTQPPSIGEAPAFVQMLEQVSRVAPLNKPVLVIGERGTGKELVAWRLHYLSGRWTGPLIKLNCSALTQGTLESELFGHDAGAFTGATKRHRGRFERAHGGTLFLDEIATIPMRMQEKILRVIEYGEFERVGASDTLRVNVRTVGATNADLPSLVRAGKFRADLLDRLAFDVIQVPPLRHRPEDILTLAQHFAVGMVRELGREYFPGFTRRAEQALRAHPWPGNVRALKNTVERSVYRASDPDAAIDQIEFDPFAGAFQEPPPIPRRDQPASEEVNSPQQDGTPQSRQGGVPRPRLPTDLKAQVLKLERTLIDEAMRSAYHRQVEAAGLLGLSYHQLRAYLRKHGLASRYGRKSNDNAP